MTFHVRKTVVSPASGVDIWTVVKKALELSLERDEPVEFTFNGTLVTIDANKIVSTTTAEQYSNKRGEPHAE